MSYKEIPEPIDTKYPTWIIAFCPDTDSFFVTNKRYFFWQSREEFESEEDGIEYFETHAAKFGNTRNEIMKFFGQKVTDSVFLENTNKEYPL